MSHAREHRPNSPATWSGRVFRFEAIDSTNERALAAVADKTARHGDVIVARTQTQGRGRRGATWHSPAGEGLYFSIVLLPSALAQPAALTMASGIAVLRAVSGLGLSGVELKWPNDLIVGDAKLVGILVETRGLDIAAPHYVVGIGVNVAQREFPPELVRARAVTSLALCGIDVTVETVLARALAELEPALERAILAPETVAAEYTVAAKLLDASVRVESHRETCVGRVRALTLAGGLTIDTDADGTIRLAIEHVRSLTRL
ncbi:MAG: biotin--[acetyl-CoA-carboxylase] ligase [Planctomycetes bacterium]|nr:biotin--[acetyl-CoA-carboxylase] ligase [Planctomycetota bacterium]